MWHLLFVYLYLYLYYSGDRSYNNINHLLKSVCLLSILVGLDKWYYLDFYVAWVLKVD